MKLLKVLSGLVVIGVLGGCASEKRKRAEFFGPKEVAANPANQKQPAPPYSRAEAEDAICEVVTRRFARDASAQLKTPVKTVFLSLTPNKLEPGPAILNRFGKASPRVVPISAATRSKESGFVDKQSGDRGIFLRIERVDWLDFYSAQVPCAWSQDTSNELAFVYSLTWKKGKWIVQ